MIDALQYRPAFLIEADGGAFASERVLSIEVLDAAGIESDELTIVLDGGGIPIATPREGAKFTVSLGYLESGLVEVGTYVFEEIERSGLDKRVTLIAKAADHTGTIKEPKTRAWPAQAFGAIIQKIAGEHELKPVVHPDLAELPIDYMAQTEESDQAFLTRLGRDTGAVITPKDGHLLATPRGSGESATGEPLPAVLVGPTSLLVENGYTLRRKPRARFGRVVARWKDAAGGITRSLTLKAADEGPSMTLRRVFQSEGEAQRAAQAKVKELRAGEGELSLSLIGDPSICAEFPIKAAVGEPDVDGDWVAARVTHRWDFGEEGGASTEVEAEFGMDEESG